MTGLGVQADIEFRCDLGCANAIKLHQKGKAEDLSNCAKACMPLPGFMQTNVGLQQPQLLAVLNLAYVADTPVSATCTSPDGNETNQLGEAPAA